MAKVTMIEAINRAHAWEMAHDPTVVVLGEDIGVNGGAGKNSDRQRSAYLQAP